MKRKRPQLKTHSWGGTFGLIALFLSLLLSLTPSAQAKREIGPETRFSPSEGQPLFPAGNLNVFKQYIIDFDLSERVGKTTGINLGFTSVEFGGELSAGVGAAFGLEVGLNFGGNADFDLGFQPTITLPDKYPYDSPIPLTVSEGFLPDSHFTTTFPPLGKAYADLVFHLEADLDATACVFGCVGFDALLSTCALPPLPVSGVKLFNLSKRVDPALDADAYCSVELASFNRGDDNTLRMINVAAKTRQEFLMEPYKEFAPFSSSPSTFSYDSSTKELFVTGASPIRSKITEGRAVQVSSSGTLPGGLDPSRIYYVTSPVNDDSPGTPQGVFFKLATSPGGPLIVITGEGTGTHMISTFEVEPPEDSFLGRYGTLSFGVPTVATDSADSMFNTAEVLKSSGAEDIMGLGIDVAQMVADFLIPPPVPPLSDSGDVGPLGWDYTFASLSLGPAVQLETEFEMTWDLVVTKITFSNPVKIIKNGVVIQEGTEYTPAPGTVHLTNRPPKALPEIQLIDNLPVVVSIAYELAPKLKAVVDTPFIGQINYEALAAGASIDRVGRLGFGPLIEGDHKFKFGEFNVFDGDPSPIASAGTGNIAFTMMASGPPSFEWDPQIFELHGRIGHFDWTTLLPPPGEIRTNWVEVISTDRPHNSFPGANDTTSSHALIDDSPFPSLHEPVTVDSLIVRADRELNIEIEGSSSGTPNLTVGGGLLENSGTINVIGDPSSLKLSSPDAVLCGLGSVRLSSGGSLRGYDGGEEFTFCNYNTIHGAGRAMDEYDFSIEPTNSVIDNLGKFSADEGGGGPLLTSASRIVNQGVFESLANSELSIYGDEFDSRLDSRVAAEGLESKTSLSFDAAEHAGLIRAGDGGRVKVAPLLLPWASWNAAQSLTNDVGFFRAEGAGSVLELLDIDMTGGCFVLGSGGALEAMDTDFTGTVFHIGDINEFLVDVDESSDLFLFLVDDSSGTLTLDGVNRQFNMVSLTNYGTVSVPGQVAFIDNINFANNGTVEVPAGGLLRIHEKINQTSAPGAPPEAINSPGTANATAETILFVEEQEVRRQFLVGGTWDIEGTLEIDGASFTGIGANAARASTGSASINDLGDEQVPPREDPEDDLSRVLSLGNPAKVILRGANWAFPALTSLEENRGSLHLVAGAVFPGGAPGSTPGDFRNKGELRIEPSSRLTVGGDFIQTGAHATTDLMSGTLVSTANTFQILGGKVMATADSDIFNRSGNTIPSGTTVRVESPLIDTNETNAVGEPVFVQEPVIVDLETGVQITTIAQGAEVTIHGAAVQFQALTNNLTLNAGTFTLSGDGIDNAGIGRFTGQALTNTGQVNVLGWTSELQAEDYTQNGASSATRIGTGANLILNGGLVINDGEIVLEIGSRPRENLFGKIKASSADFGDRLVINFTGEIVTDPSASVDIGDTWEIIPRTSSAAITGVNTNTVAYRLFGAPLPADWLPAGSHLEVIQFNTDFGPRGLGIRVVPDSGFKEYSDWATDSGFPTNFLSNPFQDANDNGIVNGQEFFFGLDGADGSASFQFVDGADGETFLQLSYVRPSGIEQRDATYTPYYSGNMVDWFVAPMFVTDISAAPGLNLQRVTLQSNFPITPITADGVFFRVQANFFNPEDFEKGVIPENPIDGVEGPLNDLGYEVGQVLFFNLPTADPNGTVYGTDIYRDFSALTAAAVHAGVLENGGNGGVVKVTILPRQDSFTGSTRNGVTSQDYTYSGPDDEPNAFSYRIEKVEEIIVANATPLVPDSDDVIIDFGPGTGIWIRYNDSTWGKLHSLSPEIIAAGDIDGGGKDEAIIDFGSSGIWVRVNNTSWVKLHPVSPEVIATGDMDGNGQDEVIIDFGLSGVWVRLNNASWVKLHPQSPEVIATGDMDGNGQDEVILDFGLSGVWVRLNNASWVKLHPTSPWFITTGDMDGNGLDEVILDFGASGIWVRFNNATWIKLHPAMSEAITTGDMDGNGRDEVIIDFGGSGIWVRFNNATWTKLHPSRSDELIVTGDMDGNGQDEVVINFGLSGLWVRGNNSAWTKLHPASPSQMATGNVDGN